MTRSHWAIKSDQELIDGLWVSTWRSFIEKILFQNVTDVVCVFGSIIRCLGIMRV